MKQKIKVYILQGAIISVIAVAIILMLNIPRQSDNVSTAFTSTTIPQSSIPIVYTNIIQSIPNFTMLCRINLRIGDTISQLCNPKLFPKVS